MISGVPAPATLEAQRADPGRRGGRRHAPAAAALLASLSLYALTLALFPATGDQDAAIHAIYTRFVTEPGRILSVWVRPMFAVPYLAPAQLGYPAMRIFTVVVCASAAWLAYLVARRVGLTRAWLAIPLTLLQPCLYQIGTDTLTEPIFALVLAGGLLGLAHGRTHVAATVWSFLPLARPEGAVVLAVVAALWIPVALAAPRRWIPITLLGCGMVAWEVAGVVATGDPGFLLHTFPWAYHTNATGPLDHYLARWPHILGVGVFVLWLAGLPGTWRMSTLRLCILLTVAVAGVHTFLLTTGRFGSLGFDRYSATLAPATALIATAGAGALAPRLDRVFPWALGALLALQAVHAWVALDSESLNHTPAATLESVRQARQRLDLRDRTVISADHFGYVFLGRDLPSQALPVGDRDASAAAIERLPVGTVVLWDNLTGDWWYHLTVEDFTSRGYRLVWERRTTVGSALAPLYDWLGQSPMRDFRQAVLVRDGAAAGGVGLSRVAAGDNQSTAPGKCPACRIAAVPRDGGIALPAAERRAGGGIQ